MKKFYPRTSKAHYTSGIAKQQQCKKILFRMFEAEAALKSKQMGKTPVGQSWTTRPADSPSLQFDESEPLPYSDPKDHYHIGTTTRYFVHIGRWLGGHSDDPALAVSTSLHTILLSIQTQSTQDFLPCLKDHLLGQLLN